jgi:transposase
MTKTESKWSERVEEWRASGQSAEDYARERDFKASTLRWWSSQLLRRASCVGAPVQMPPSVRMVRAVASGRPAASRIVVRIGAAHVEVQAGFDVALLHEVVRALGGAR